MSSNPQSEWDRLKGRRHGLEDRWEKYAGYTLPRLFTDSNWDEDTDELTFDWQSVGAQSTNHVVNKLMLALFAPSRPFMRLEGDPAWLATLDPKSQQLVETTLSTAELSAVKELDALPGTRAKLYLTLAYLVVLGNVCIHLPESKKTAPRIFGVQGYVVRRTSRGEVKSAVIRESLKFDELDAEVQKVLRSSKSAAMWRDDTEVKHYRHIMRNDKGGYELVQYVDNIRLPSQFDGRWADEESLPYRFLVWNLKDGNHYGTGLVEDYSADFGALSTLSEAQVKAAVLASEYRWLVNPAGMTKVEDFENSENGAALPGQQGDVSLINNNKPGDLQVVANINSEYIQRIGRGFLLGSAVTRDSERTTATEIRMQALELETSFGGTYSSIAAQLQMPLAKWLLRNVNLEIKGSKIKVSIVTGLDALSRSGDLDALRAALQDLAQVGLIKQAVPRLNEAAVADAIFAGHGLPPSKYMLSEEEFQKQEAAKQQQMINAQAAMAGAKAGASQQGQV